MWRFSGRFVLPQQEKVDSKEESHHLNSMRKREKKATPVHEAVAHSLPNDSCVNKASQKEMLQ